MITDPVRRLQRLGPGASREDAFGHDPARASRTAPGSGSPAKARRARAAARSGDLYIFVSVAPHRLFSRDGANIYCRIPIPFTTAALGGQIEVPTIEGKRARIQVPAGTQTGHRFRLRGKGMTELHGHARGDMFAEIVVETPVNLTKRQQELLREFEDAGNGATHPESEGFFARVRELWDELRD